MNPKQGNMVETLNDRLSGWGPFVPEILAWKLQIYSVSQTDSTRATGGSEKEANEWKQCSTTMYYPI